MEETAPVWYTLAGGPHPPRRQGVRETLVPLGNEVGFCLNTKAEGRAGRHWQLFRWNDEVTRIYY